MGSSGRVIAFLSGIAFDKNSVGSARGRDGVYLQ